MNPLKKIFLLFALVLFAGSLVAQYPAKPNPPRLVNDFTNTLTQEQADAIEQKLVAFDDSTSTQIAVVIVDNINGASISDYNQELGRKWGVGNSKNNGVLLLIAKTDRKLDIAVGYGLEGALTDATSQQIIDDIIVPNFKGDDYYRGIDLGTDAIIQAVKGEFHQERTRSASGKSSGGSKIGIIIFIIIMILIFSRKGGGGGTFMSRRGGTGIAEALLWSSILGGGRGGGGGGWSGGDGSSGGFGGFGGGSFGGGGASGSW